MASSSTSNPRQKSDDSPNNVLYIVSSVISTGTERVDENNVVPKVFSSVDDAKSYMKKRAKKLFLDHVVEDYDKSDDEDTPVILNSNNDGEGYYYNKNQACVDFGYEGNEESYCEWGFVKIDKVVLDEAVVSKQQKGK